MAVLPTLTFGQSTTVTGNVTDLGGQIWSKGSVVATFVPSGGTQPNQYTWTGGAFNGQAITALTDSSGNYSLSLPSNTELVPANSKWTLTANSGTTALATGTATLIISGVSQTVNFAPPTLIISAGPGAVAYTDSEVAAQYGQTYYSITLGALRICTTSIGTLCTAWVNPSSGVSGNGTANLIAKWSGSTALGNSSLGDDGLTPVTAPNGIDTVSNGIYIERVVDAGGVVANKLACRSGIVKVQICPINTISGVLGVAQSTLSAGASAKICSWGKCNVISTNNFTAGDWLIPSTTVAGNVDDTGSSLQPTTGTQTFLAESTGLATNPVVTALLSPDTLLAGATGMPNPMTTLGDTIYEGATVPTRLAGPTTPNGVAQIDTSTPSGGVAQAPVWSLPGIAINAQTGTTYTILATDRMKYVSHSNGSSIAVTLPQAGTAGFTSGFSYFTCDIGVGTVTITPTTSTISYTTGVVYTSGAANIVLTTGQCVSIYSDNSNYFASFRGSGAKLECSPGIGDGLNAIPAGTYLQFNCVNKSGSTWTITGISCWTDNAGSSTLNVANNAATGLLTGAVTCNSTKSGGGAAGTQSGTTTLANNDAISFTFVADGTSKQTTWTVSLTQ